jgi:AcrR family transcriptional regulator
MDYLEKAAGLSHGTLYRAVRSKAEQVKAVYAHALALLLVGAAPISKHEFLREQLRRCWHFLAAALAQPRAFTFWTFYRSCVYAPAPTSPALGPFAQLLRQLHQARAPRSWESLSTRVVSPELLATSYFLGGALDRRGRAGAHRPHLPSQRDVAHPPAHARLRELVAGPAPALQCPQVGRSCYLGATSQSNLSGPSRRVHFPTLFNDNTIVRLLCI